MRISNLTLHHVRLPFKLKVGHNLATRDFSENLVVAITTSEGITGYGEGIPRDYVTGENIESAFAVISSHADTFSGKIFNTFSELKIWLDTLGSSSLWQNHPSAFCALELALLDAAGKYWKLPVHGLLSSHRPQKDSIQYSAVIPFSHSTGFTGLLQRFKGMNIPHFKIKVGKTIDWKALQEARDILGEDVDIRVDANCAWQPKESIPYILKLAELGIRSVEQPIAPLNIEGLKFIKKNTACNIIIDEGLSRIENAQSFAADRACDIFNIRLSKCGGIINSMKIYSIGKSVGIRSQLGAQVGESGILSAAGRHFAALHPDLVYHEGSFGSMLLTKDLTKEDLVFGDGGKAPMLNKPGLGIEINHDHLKKLTIKENIF